MISQPEATVCPQFISSQPFTGIENFAAECAEDSEKDNPIRGKGKNSPAQIEAREGFGRTGIEKRGTIKERLAPFLYGLRVLRGELLHFIRSGGILAERNASGCSFVPRS